MSFWPCPCSLYTNIIKNKRKTILSREPDNIYSKYKYVLFTTTTLFQRTVTTLFLHNQIITSTSTTLQPLKSLLPPKIIIFVTSYWILRKTIHGKKWPLWGRFTWSWAWKIGSLMRNFNERAMRLNEEGKTKWQRKRVLVPFKVFISE